ncbi:GtrA family protein [bacterium]|nr:GtrA family protein [bacterium]
MNNLINKYFIARTDTTHIQFFRYIFVGGLATAVDMGSFYFADNILNLHYLIAQTIGFLLGLAANYLISVAWVFESTGNVKKEFAIFALIGVGGLFWSYLILWIVIDILGLHYFQDMLAKSIAVALVLIWNFGMRKKFAFDSQ